MDNPDQQVGVNILRRALEEPIRRIVGNAGQDGSVVVREVRGMKNKPTYGYDVISGEYVDMIKAGIIDPVKVTRGALQNAASIASMILTTEALVTDIPEKKEAPAMPPGGGMGGDF
jgi:chaperonin GroEL